MSNATAFAQVRNPASGDDALNNAMANAEAAAAATAAGNDEEPIRSTFFRHLESHAEHGGSDCLSWRVGRFDDYASAERMARVDRAVAGIEGVLAVIHAADLAADSGEEEATFSPYMLDRLMFAARALTESARDSIEQLREQARGAR